MNKKRSLILSIFTIILLTGCDLLPADTPDTPNLTAKQGYEFINDNSNNPDFVILDVRTPDEFKSGHIENAVNIDYHGSTFIDEVGKLDKNKTYIMYCKSGNRAKKSYDVMKELGFENIYNIGGVNQWITAGYKLTPPGVQ